MREDRGHAEVARRLLCGIVPVLAPGLAVERAQKRPGRTAVAALEDPRGLRSREHAAVRDGQARHLRQRKPVLGVRQALAGERPGVAEVAAAPDTGAVPLARRGRVDGARRLVVDRVVDGPALAERAAHLPVTPGSVALEHEAALAGSDQQHHPRHLIAPSSQSGAAQSGGRSRGAQARARLRRES